jgi:hypothetical protein
MNMAREREQKSKSSIVISWRDTFQKARPPRETERELYIEQIYLVVVGAQIGRAGQEPEMDPGRVTRLGERTEMNEGD